MGHVHTDYIEPLLEAMFFPDPSWADEESVSDTRRVRAKALQEEWRSLSSDRQEARAKFCFGNVGSRDDTLIAVDFPESGLQVRVGCFLGPLEAFESAVIESRSYNARVLKQYEAIVECIVAVMSTQSLHYEPGPSS